MHSRHGFISIHFKAISHEILMQLGPHIRNTDNTLSVDNRYDFFNSFTQCGLVENLEYELVESYSTEKGSPFKGTIYHYQFYISI